ncbi:hypothetical protein TanjilG_31150 [Lupinus angustifolius]|uniref:Uncharacterized protein n=1 Tax=Lupinus angustifolius TaxID=3871 RepID=A0A1J7FW81_LUPAN|nr:PREDICTED: auxin-repressed 12.5 kDa protein-like [Lupinus angustifolius]XP_019425326.1 PREDICTED: auxin-repressed 12.5 kDa protein-like [Lupinus angustifolius]XP_019425327.1 PREDICTED: auxin-repressed 12.5 kDa protein-like [Lupinus angustifolius]XP_019425329.1 PREDICTED: auxin-repressed 12.5 kDa protein-like [Lupinus angustifolius]OIV92231.1 hypothetical protein TanjilG_31150 [Lupinus angustifolius]
MVLLEKLWDDVVAGPHPDRDLGRLRKITTSQPLNITKGEGSNKYHRAILTQATQTTPLSGRRVLDNIWRSVFHPGSNLATKTIGAEMFDKPLPNSPTVYDLLYSCETKSKHL